MTQRIWIKRCISNSFGSVLRLKTIQQSRTNMKSQIDLFQVIHDFINLESLEIDSNYDPLNSMWKLKYRDVFVGEKSMKNE